MPAFSLLLPAWLALAGCSTGPVFIDCSGEDIEVLAPDDDVLGFSAQDVLERVGHRDWSVAWDPDFAGSFDTIQLDLALTGDVVHRTRADPDLCVWPDEEFLYLPVSWSAVSDDASFSVAGEGTVWVTSNDDEGTRVYLGYSAVEELPDDISDRVASYAAEHGGGDPEVRAGIVGFLSDAGRSPLDLVELGVHAYLDTDSFSGWGTVARGTLAVVP
ncbi:MAG: hypothetical protein D6798_03070 [Deltaproteobacteria bacterium]|nr:MAG: hypothetical protein D6798_03070 [Deltaproteobacteria bacterium]